jgi:hypothetical protein
MQTKLYLQIAVAAPAKGAQLKYAKNDAWAAGMVIWAMISRTPPFHPDRDDPQKFADDDRQEPAACYSCPALREVIAGLLTVDAGSRMEATAGVALLEPHLAPALAEGRK